MGQRPRKGNATCRITTETTFQERHTGGHRHTETPGSYTDTGASGCVSCNITKIMRARSTAWRKQCLSITQPTFKLPLKTHVISVAEVRTQLYEATKTYWLRQKDSVALRYRSYLNLPSKYENDKDPDTKSESTRREKVARNTIRSEQVGQWIGTSEMWWSDNNRRPHTNPNSPSHNRHHIPSRLPTFPGWDGRSEYSVGLHTGQKGN